MPSFDRLRDYRRKRTPGRTSEPKTAISGGPQTPGQARKKPIFVVQRHDARRLHYDLRLERDGALASWAVPNGIPLETGQRHLAVHVEDHPLEYAEFAGEIPKGQYGAGTVEIWDRGTYELVEEKRNGGLTFRLRGRRLEGTWTLVPARLGGDEKNWLLLRKGAHRASSGRRYKPMLATLADSLPRGEGWLFEPKWDGYRTLAYVRGGEVELRSRTGKSALTERFDTVAQAIPRAVRTPDCVLDGEVCALDDSGRASFSAMQQGRGKLVYYVFDLLEADGERLLELPFTERRRRLVRLLDRRSRSVVVSEAFDDGESLLEAASAQGLEGVMAKRADAPYVERRSSAWLKIKPRPRQELVVCGYTKGQGKRARLGALVLGVHDRGELRWAGNVGTGFTEEAIEELLPRLRELERPDPPFPHPPRMPRVRRGDAVWVEPRLVAEVEFAEWTHQGRLRAPSFLGLREDKPAADVRREEPLPREIRRGARVLRLSNLEKVFWPEQRITKGDLLAYYREIAPVLLPHLRDRPFTMKRYPDGIAGKFFFQKNPRDRASREFGSTMRRGAEKYLFVNYELALLWMVNMGCIDMNASCSRIDNPDRPDWVVFDLDPSPDVGFAEVVEVALLVKAMLDGIGLEGFAKTSGADGMHVLVPIQRRSTYADTREFASVVARALASTHRGLVTTEWTRAKRRGVLIDAKQNREGATTASVYSVRPVPGAPVSTPLAWEEVTAELDPRAFTMDVVLRRVASEGDLFGGVLGGGQSLAKALRSVV